MINQPSNIMITYHFDISLKIRECSSDLRIDATSRWVRDLARDQFAMNVSAPDQ